MAQRAKRRKESLALGLASSSRGGSDGLSARALRRSYYSAHPGPQRVDKKRRGKLGEWKLSPRFRFDFCKASFAKLILAAAAVCIEYNNSELFACRAVTRILSKAKHYILRRCELFEQVVVLGAQAREGTSAGCDE